MNQAARGNHRELELIRKLDDLVVSHVRWLSELNRALVCGTQASSSMVSMDAHLRCSFGEWYSRIDHEQGDKWAVQAKKLDSPHKQMHDCARILLKDVASKSVASADYDCFSATAARFESALRAFQIKVIRDVCLVDHLTGAWNRAALMQRLTQEYDRMVRSGASCCLSMMDVDYFKLINDRFGHGVGDHVLQCIVNIASQRLRRYDSLIRYGGEEFLFCLPNTTLNEAVLAMERVRIDIEATPITLKNSQSISVQASFGVVEMLPSLSIDESIEAADHALLRAKATGRNRVCC